MARNIRITKEEIIALEAFLEVARREDWKGRDSILVLRRLLEKAKKQK